MTIGNSYLTATRFGLTIDDPMFKDIEMAITAWPHPSVTRNPVQAPARAQNVPYAGSRYEYEPLQVQVQLDAGMDNYWKLYDWLLSENERDVILTAYGPNDKASTQVRYQNAFVTNMGAINFQAGDQTDEVLVLDVTLYYTKFEKV